MRAMGADVRAAGTGPDQPHEEAVDFAAETGAVLVEDGRDAAIAEGAGRSAMELLRWPEPFARSSFHSAIGRCSVVSRVGSKRTFLPQLWSAFVRQARPRWSARGAAVRSWRCSHRRSRWHPNPDAVRGSRH